MRLDITRILCGEVDVLPFDMRIPAGDDGEFSFFTEWGITFDGDISAKGCVRNNGGYMSLSVQTSVGYGTCCARCLKEMHRTFEHSFEKGVAIQLTNEDNDDFILIDGGCVDVASAVCEEFLLSFPLKELCDESCLGLCPKCGKNLNEGKCACESDGDPRMAKLKALLSDFE